MFISKSDEKSMVLCYLFTDLNNINSVGTDD